MTTIAADFRAGIMVSDSRCGDGSTWYPTTKIYRLNGELLGFAGSVKDINRWMKWHTGGRKGPHPKLESFGGLILRASGLVKADADGAEIPIERGFHACGSGEHAALAALLLGHSAREAVEVACLVDANTGGDICVVHLVPEKATNVAKKATR